MYINLNAIHFPRYNMETQIDITVAGHNYLLHSQNTITLKDS